MPQEHTIAALTRGRYLLEVPQGSGPFPLLVGFHGYAENADRHLEALRALPGASGWILCAIQGLSRFYHPRTQEVIAGWMTRQDRELAIQDNVRYVGDVVARLKRELPLAGTLVYAGFSQGVAMAYRAAAFSGHHCHGLLALAGDVPPDLGEDDLTQLPPVLIGRGTEDTWYDTAKMTADLDRLATGGVQVETCVFTGGHEWHAEFYQAAGEFLARR